MSNARKDQVDDILPWKNDFVFYIIARIGRSNPVLIGISYFIIEFIFMYVIGYFTGQLHGKNGLAPMYLMVLDNINMGFVAPVGAALLSNLYYTINSAFKDIQSEKLIPNDQLRQFNEFKIKLNKLYASKTAITIAFMFAFSFNIYNYLTKTDSWLGINGGITGVYGRFFAALNYSILTLLVYKCAITLWAMNKTLRFDLQIRPFHPDRSGGLKMIGRLAISLNYFVALVLVFFTLMLVFDEFAKKHTIYLTIFILFYPFSIVFFFTSLLGAHRKMMICKREVLEKLGKTFDYYYRKLNEKTDQHIYELESADQISTIHNLYQIAEKMPVWPFDKDSLVRAFTSLALPTLIFILDAIIKADSIVTIISKLVTH